MGRVVVDVDAAINRMHEWVRSMDVDDLAAALSELGEYEGQEVVVRCVDVDSSPHCGGNLCEEDE